MCNDGHAHHVNGQRVSPEFKRRSIVQHQAVACCSSDQPKWTFKLVSGSDTFTIKSEATGNYLYAQSTGKTSLQMTSTASPTTRGQWKLTEQGCSAGGNYYYFKNVGRSMYMQSGFSYPGLTSSATSKFYVTSTGGSPLCNVAKSNCDKQCKQGTLVSWYNDECKSDSCTKTNAQTNTENAALKTCNARCKTCGVWDTNCKSCGGTIDKTGLPKKANGSGSGSGGYRYYRQCDCNSAFKTGGLSILAILMVFFNFKFQAQ